MVACSAAGEAPETVRISGAAEATAGNASASTAVIRESFRIVAITVGTPAVTGGIPE